jgi:hypothetical protein
MYLWIPWELVVDPLGSVQHTFGTTDLAHSLVTVLTVLSWLPVALVVDLCYDSVFEVKSKIIHSKGLYFHGAQCSVKEYNEWVVSPFQFVLNQIIVFRSVTPYCYRWTQTFQVNILLPSTRSKWVDLGFSGLCRLGAGKVGNLTHRKRRGCALKPEPTETVGGGGCCVLCWLVLPFSSLLSVNLTGHFPCILPLMHCLLTHHRTCEDGGAIFLQNGIHW